MKKLSISETLIRGQWILKDHRVVADDVCSRIDWLVKNDLQFIKSDISGWKKLYLDPNDSRYWELSYPESELQGGGPPMLAHISKQDAKTIYEI